LIISTLRILRNSDIIMVVTCENGNGNGNKNGIRRPKPPNFAITSISAPSNSPDRMQQLAETRRNHAEANQKASDDTRLHQLQKTSRRLFVIEEESDGEPKKLQFSSFATIKGGRFNKFPIYTVQAVSDDRLILSSIGVPHREVVVVNKTATFNGISMGEFRSKDILKSGDQVLVEKQCYWYTTENFNGEGWRSVVPDICIVEKRQHLDHARYGQRH